MQKAANSAGGDVMTVQAVCPKCGAKYTGWALKEEKHQYCEACGTKLEVKDVE